MKYKLLCDYQENFKSVTAEGNINDHQDKETFENILNAIKKRNHTCEILEGVPALIKAIHEKTSFKNTIFLNLSDGMSQRYSRVQIPILCELLNVPYSGGNAFTVALTSNKFYTKIAVERLGIVVPEGILISQKNYPDKFTLRTLKYPLIVKPNTEGSSIGITQESICKTENELLSFINYQIKKYDELLVEQFISGYDVTDFIIGNKGSYYLNEPMLALKKGNLIQGADIMSYLDYIHRDNWYTPPEEYISQGCIEHIRNISTQICEQLGTYDIARIDYRVTKEEKIYFLEINTVPAVHPKSQAGAICNHLNISFETFVDYWVTAVTERIQNNVQS